MIRKLTTIKFQSTLPRRERHCTTLTLYRVKMSFNPRSREGSDLDTGDDSGALKISIHAPAKGATMVTCMGILVF